MLDLCHHAYLYAQALDNQGEPEYWRSREAGATFNRLKLDDSRLPLIRGLLDEVTATGRRWRIGAASLDCRINWKGECVITVQPVTRDSDGRISPVLILFNALGRGRRQTVVALDELEGLMGRALGPGDRQAIDNLKTLLSRPRLVLITHILIFSRSARND